MDSRSLDPPPQPPPPPTSMVNNEEHPTSSLGTGAQHPPPPPPTPTPPMGEPAPMALCAIPVAGCGEHLPAWGLRDDRMLGTDQAVRGGRHGQKVHSGSPPPPPQGQGDACVS